MRTWKQGVVGRLILSNGNIIFIKCLKYPLAVFYQIYDSKKQVLENELFQAFLDLSVLKYIDKIAEFKITVTEKKLAMLFSMEYKYNTLNINTALKMIPNGLITYQDIEKILNN